MIGPKRWALVLFVFGNPLYAQDQAATESTQEESGFSGGATLNLRSSTTNSSDPSYQILLNPSVRVGYEFEDLFSVDFDVRGNQALNNEQRSTLTGATVSLSRSFEYTKALAFSLSGYYGAPVSKDLIKYSNSKGTVGGSGGVDYSFDGVLSGLKINASLTYERYLYQYEYTNGGSILTKYGWSQDYGFSYTWDSLTFSTSFTNVSTWDFDGEQENDSYLWVETLRYKVNANWSAHIGHINDGNTYDYLGAANNVRFYDKRRSQVFIGTSYSF